MPPPDASSHTTQLLTSSSLNLKLHAQGHPTAANAAARDAALAAESAPHLPAPWLALFSACHAASDFQGARDALTEGLHYCPYDQALQLLAAAANSSSSNSASRQNSSSSSHAYPTTPTTPTSPISHTRPPHRTRSQTLVQQHLLRAADEAVLKGRHDDAIAKYTTLINAIPPSTVEHPSLRALSRRSDTWLKKAIADDDPRCFASAIADAAHLVSLAPHWDEAWLRLGTAHLENGCPARARHCFTKGLRHCNLSTRLSDGLRDSEFVIHDEGNETDWEDDGPQQDERIMAPKKYRGKRHITHSNASTASDSTTDPELSYRMSDNSQLLSNNSQSTNQDQSSLPRVHSDKDREIRRKNSDSSNRQVQSLRSNVFNRPINELDHQSLSSRFRFSRQVSRNAAVERLGQTRPDGAARPTQWDPLPSYLQTTREALAAESSARPPLHTDPMAGSSAVLSMKQRKLYDVLGIPQDATVAAIRKSYFQLARQYHPDKNSEDEQATLKFQQVAEAYAVLSDSETRAIYDREGDRGLTKNSVDTVDPSTLFAMVFGSEQFVPLIGELQLASLANNVDDDGNAPTEAVLNGIQKSRVGRLVLEMVKLLKPWVDGDKRGFLKSTSQLMRHLRTASFGPELLQTVGNVYVQQTAYLQDKSKPFNLSAVMRKASLRSHKIASHHKAMSAAGKVMEKQRKLHDRVMRSGKDNRSISGEEARSIAVEMAGNAIDMMWKISVIDIETTLEDVLLIVLSGRDLIADGDFFTFPEVSNENTGSTERGRHRRRLHSYLGNREAREPGRGREGARHDVSLVRPIAPLCQGEPAVSRQQILSERAYGIQAMGRIFMSANR